MIEISELLQDGKKSFHEHPEDYYRLKLGLLFGNLPTVNGLLKILKSQDLLDEDIPTPYSSTFMFILTESKDKYYVQALFNKRAISLGGKCDQSDTCELENFLDYFNSLVDKSLINSKCGTNL